MNVQSATKLLLVAIVFAFVYLSGRVCLPLAFGIPEKELLVLPSIRLDDGQPLALLLEKITPGDSIHCVNSTLGGKPHKWEWDQESRTAAGYWRLHTIRPNGEIWYRIYRGEFFGDRFVKGFIIPD